jgi:signal peptidase I
MWKLLRWLAWTSVVLAALIGLLRLTAIRWWQVPLGDPYLEASLAPSLQGGDWIILWRATDPVEGDLVLCPEPKTPNRPVIARILAEGNDHIKIEGSAVRVNRNTFDTESGCERFTVRSPTSGQEVEQGCRQELVGSKMHLRGEVSEAAPKPAEAEFDVAHGQFFLISDNRQFPWDSRDFGPVARETCVETVIFRMLSKDGFFDVAHRLMLIR